MCMVCGPSSLGILASHSKYAQSICNLCAVHACCSAMLELLLENICCIIFVYIYSTHDVLIGNVKVARDRETSALVLKYTHVSTL
jgi:hypothetical protein